MVQAARAGPEGQLALPAALPVPDQPGPQGPLQAERALIADPDFPLVWTAPQPHWLAFWLRPRLPFAVRHFSAVQLHHAVPARTHAFVLPPADQLLPEPLSAAVLLRVWLPLQLLSVAQQPVAQRLRLLFDVLLLRLHSADRLCVVVLRPRAPPVQLHVAARRPDGRLLPVPHAAVLRLSDGFPLRLRAVVLQLGGGIPLLPVPFLPPVVGGAIDRRKAVHRYPARG